jgi:hypothetical protein
MPITFTGTYPGAQIEVAMLGDIEVGRIMADGRNSAWACHLRPSWTWDWRPAKSPEAARDAIRKTVENWIEQAGLKIKGETDGAA